MNKLLGINLAETPSTTPTQELGAVVDDPRGGQGQITYTEYPNGIPTAVTVTRNFYPGARYKYIKAGNTITAGDAVKLDVSVTLLERDATVIRTAAADERWEGVAVASMTVGQYGWICVRGRFNNANVADAAVAGAIVAPSATAGRLATPVASAANALAAGSGRGAIALEDGDANNQADIEIC